MAGSAHDRAVPSMPTIPSTMARWGRTVALMSRIGLGDSRVVEHILGPAVIDPRHDPEEILHRKRDARPMVGLELGHRDDQIRPAQ